MSKFLGCSLPKTSGLDTRRSSPGIAEPSPKIEALASDLLLRVLAVSQEGCVEGIAFLPGNRGGKAEPMVVNPALWDRKKRFEKAAAEYACGSGDQRLTQQDTCLGFPTTVVAFDGLLKAQTAPEPCARGLELSIDQARIAEAIAELRGGLEDLGLAHDLVEVPNVVLVAEEDQVPGATSQCVGKVATGTARPWVLKDHPFKGGCGKCGFGDGDRCIGGGIVGEDELVRQTALRQDAAQLSFEERGALVGRQGDGDAATRRNDLCHRPRLQRRP